MDRDYHEIEIYLYLPPTEIQLLNQWAETILRRGKKATY